MKKVIIVTIIISLAFASCGSTKKGCGLTSDADKTPNILKQQKSVAYHENTCKEI